MIRSAPIRIAGMAVGLCIAAALPFHAQKREPAPVVRAAPPAQSGGPNSSRLAPIERKNHPNAPKNMGEHLPEWMGQHSNLTPQQQQQALEKEPGFHDLPAQTQQRMRDQLSRLNAMPPAQRERVLERNEAIEKMTPDQRVQFRSAMKQLADLPPEQRRYVARTFRGLRELTPQQRANVLASDRFDHLTPEQRSTLNNLMKVEPFMPPPYDSGAPVNPQQLPQH